jgi:cyclopropane-fatty-acyl-phospholipid synthase
MTFVAAGTPSLGASTQAVKHHYDLNNEFYGLWLDETRTYSCAMWSNATSLREAQERKLRYHIECAHAAGARRVLDVGCGWGALLTALVTEAGVGQAVGLTLSNAQADWVLQRPNPKIEVAVESWEHHIPPEKYDAIISIGAFEHFARPDIAESETVTAYRRFFAKCYEWLVPGGCMSIQTIAYGNATRADLNRFIIDEIFPESDLPTLSAIDCASRGMFEIISVRNDRRDYERTLENWYFNLRRQKRRAIELIGQEAVENYEKYLSLFMVGFHTGAMNLLRVAFRRDSSNLRVNASKAP